MKKELILHTVELDKSLLKSIIYNLSNIKYLTNNITTFVNINENEIYLYLINNSNKIIKRTITKQAFNKMKKIKTEPIVIQKEKILLSEQFINQVMIDKEYLKKINKKNITDIRNKLLFPLIYDYFKINILKTNIIENRILFI